MTYHEYTGLTDDTTFTLFGQYLNLYIHVATPAHKGHDLKPH